MYKTCPKCGFSSDPSARPSDSCPACGLVYQKWLKSLAADTDRQETEQQPQQQQQQSAIAHSKRSRLAAFLFAERPGIKRGELAVYSVIWLVACAWGIDFISMDIRSAEIMATWFHNIDLVIHETGHVIFMPFGRSMMLLGGSLFQVLLPLIFMFAFLWMNRDAFAASICLWWAGQSMLDVAPYIADARRLQLPLLGGGTGMDSPGRHDWAALLRPRGLLAYDETIASATHMIGSGLLLLALLWGAYMLRVYSRGRIE